MALLSCWRNVKHAALVENSPKVSPPIQRVNSRKEIPQISKHIAKEFPKY